MSIVGEDIGMLRLRAPSVMIVTVDMQDLLALDTHNTKLVSMLCALLRRGQTHPARRHSVNPIRHHKFVMFIIGLPGVILPVPRTTTSYSGAMSSMMAIGASTN